MGTQADAGPVGRLFGVGEWIAIFHEGGHKFVDQMRMRTAMTGTLRKAQMGFLSEVVNAVGGETANGRGQKFSEIGHFDFLRDFFFWELCRVDDVRFVFDERPLE